MMEGASSGPGSRETPAADQPQAAAMGQGTRPRVLVVIGTRPEAIKMAPVVAALRGHRNAVETDVVLTGQHSDLVDQALADFDLRPDHDLGIMREGQSLYDVAEGCLRGLREVVVRRAPRLILVQGDTASVFFGALVGYFEGVAVGHVEAGLRSGNLRSPFPEEGFRRLTGVLADLHFAPTAEARDHLLREGVPGARIHLTGNPVVDALLQVARRVSLPVDPTLARLLEREADGKGPFMLLTAHRRESFGPPLERAFKAVVDILDDVPGLECLFPVHPNPRVREPAVRILGDHPRVHLVDPLTYPDLVQALRAAALVLTDSGGIQEEAPTFGTPVLVLREVTERPEGVRAGVATLVGTDPTKIISEARAALQESPTHRERRQRQNPYGDGKAGERIAEAILGFLSSSEPGTGAGEGGA
jgi:UDP-N-acetylglucosamine 2-epimerase (non-hydrolysing)